MNMQSSLLLAAALALVLPAFSQAAAKPAAPSTVPVKAADTRAALRDLWIGHVFWVRNVVDASFDGDTAASRSAEQQVVANAKAIAGSIEPFYGKPASDALFGLLAGHWGAIKDRLEATKAGDKSREDASMKAMLKNADEIAAFLSGANPNLRRDTLYGLLTAHGGHHVQQIDQFKAKQYDAEAKTWAAMTNHMYVIADALANGIAKQFPDKFR
jgi:hypothetical protein